MQYNEYIARKIITELEEFFEVELILLFLRFFARPKIA